MRKMTTVSTSLFFVSASVIQIRLLYGYGNANENRSFFHYGNKKVSSLVVNVRGGVFWQSERHACDIGNIFGILRACLLILQCVCVAVHVRRRYGMSSVRSRRMIRCNRWRCVRIKIDVPSAFLICRPLQKLGKWLGIK